MTISAELRKNKTLEENTRIRGNNLSSQSKRYNGKNREYSIANTNRLIKEIDGMLLNSADTFKEEAMVLIERLSKRSK